MGDWKDAYESRKTSATEAVRAVQCGHTVFLGNACGEPQTLVEALIADCARLEAVRIVSAFPPDGARYLQNDLRGHFAILTLQIGGPMVQAVRDGRADYVPCNLSQIPRLLTDGPLVPDVALVQVAPPNADGYCSFGVSVDFTMSAAQAARTVVAEVNGQMPRTFGNCTIHVSRLTWVVESSRPVLTFPAPPPPDEVSLAVASRVAELIPDGATIQIGIGIIPNAILGALGQKRDLGVHSGMMSDALVPLMRSGVITNAAKAVNTGKAVTSMLLGTEALYRFAHENPDVEMHPATYTQDAAVIGRIANFVAINSAIEIDLTGQVNAESIGGLQVSGVGGQQDFIRGAARSPGGKSIIALPSTAAGGKRSRIVPRLGTGAAVTTTKADLHYVVTEYGVADLRGKGLRERARCLAAIAHPDFRAELVAG
ncbi:MAG: acetyl-CoA hydrolase/transferase family protein [Chloroflexi bacterium]|nr:acetyl-CoA hydrolase/transferase family protein [Chloroflexota bacterium]